MATLDQIVLRLEQAASLFTGLGLTGPQVVDLAAFLAAVIAFNAIVTPLIKVLGLLVNLAGVVGIGPAVAGAAAVGAGAAVTLVADKLTKDAIDNQTSIINQKLTAQGTTLEKLLREQEGLPKTQAEALAQQQNRVLERSAETQAQAIAQQFSSLQGQNNIQLAQNRLQSNIVVEDLQGALDALGDPRAADQAKATAQATQEANAADEARATLMQELKQEAANTARALAELNAEQEKQRLQTSRKLQDARDERIANLELFEALRREGVSSREAFAFLLSISRGTGELTKQQTAILLDFADRTKRTLEEVISGTEEAAERARQAFPSQPDLTPEQQFNELRRREEANNRELGTTRERALAALEAQADAEQRTAAAVTAYNTQLEQQIALAELGQRTLASFNSTMADILAGFTSFEEGMKRFFPEPRPRPNQHVPRTDHRRCQQVAARYFTDPFPNFSRGPA